MKDIEVIQNLEQDLQGKVSGIKTRIQTTQGAGSWLDVSNGEKGMSIRCLNAKFALSVLPEEDDAEAKIFTDQKLLIAEVLEYLK